MCASTLHPEVSIIDPIVQLVTTSSTGKGKLLEKILPFVDMYPDKYAGELETISTKFLMAEPGKEADPKIFHRITRSIENAPIDQRLASLRELLSAYKYLPEKEHSAALHAIGEALAQLPDSALVSKVKEEWQTCSNNSSWEFA